MNLSGRGRRRSVRPSAPVDATPERTESAGLDPRRSILLDEARRTIEQQIKDLDSLRGRATSLITLAVAVATFLVGSALREGVYLHCWGIVGIALLAVAVGASLTCLWPSSFTFNLNVEAIDDAIHDGRSADEIARNNAFGLRDAGSSNQKKLDRMMRVYVGALVAAVTGAVVLAASLMWR